MCCSDAVDILEVTLKMEVCLEAVRTVWTGHAGVLIVFSVILDMIHQTAGTTKTCQSDLSPILTIEIIHYLQEILQLI